MEPREIDSTPSKSAASPPPSSARRIVQVVRPATGGMRRHVSLLIAALDRTRFDPLLCAPEAFKLEEIPGRPIPPVRHYPIPIQERTQLVNDFHAIATLTRLLRSGLDGQVELVHSHGIRAALIGLLAARRARLPGLFTAHNLLPPMGRISQILFRIVANQATRVIAVSEAVAGSLRANGVSASRIVVISNGIDLNPFDNCLFDESQYQKIIAEPTTRQDSYPFPPGSNKEATVVAIGRLATEKGFDLLIDAFELVGQQVPEARLLIAGDGPERNALEARAAKSPVAERIRLLGRIDDTVSLLRNATVVAVPSRQEGQGLVALEAMAARRPVVATAVGGLIETIVPDETGLMVAPESPIALAEALITLLLVPERCRKLGENGRLRVERHYTLERMMDKIQSVYASL